MQDKFLLVALACASIVSARNLRCPPEIATDSVFANRLSSSKYFRCSPLRLLESFECSDGELFDPDLLVCHKPIAGRCGCPPTPCPCPTTTPCPCPTTTTPCPCPTTTTPCPCPQTAEQHNQQQIIEQQIIEQQIIQQQNLQATVKACEQCVAGEVRTPIPDFVVTPPPVVSYDRFGVKDVPPGYVIITDPPLPPC
ncbi:uncharacterized protein LOC119082032 isoform X2 [Bradysia coprophila]|uniref:uncharacterized protein LOC119082032 isoform X2 n=1 Tax=Bradysia coprophila TaxID=38358 RepID=UPI00187D7B4C|nr:uncharacterized protein LOC119082032 isoform X2 [Bradysia coprophila]